MTYVPPPPFSKMIEIVPEGASGSARVEHYTTDETIALLSSLQSMKTGIRSDCPEGRWCRLLVHGGVMMSDTPMEQRSNRPVVQNAFGHVFIAGLGLGMILHPICAKANVTKVTVLEKNPDVIALVAKTVPSKVEIVEADVFAWKPAQGQKFETLYFDIWPDICTDNLKQMTKLHRRFSHYKADGAWMGSWMWDELKAKLRREKKHPMCWLG